MTAHVDCSLCQNTSHVTPVFMTSLYLSWCNVALVVTFQVWLGECPGFTAWQVTSAKRLSAANASLVLIDWRTWKSVEVASGVFCCIYVLRCVPTNQTLPWSGCNLSKADKALPRKEGYEKGTLSNILLEGSFCMSSIDIIIYNYMVMLPPGNTDVSCSSGVH